MTQLYVAIPDDLGEWVEAQAAEAQLDGAGAYVASWRRITHEVEADAAGCDPSHRDRSLALLRQGRWFNRVGDRRDERGW